MIDTEPFHDLDSLVTVLPDYATKTRAGAIFRVIDTPGGRRTSYKVQDIVTGTTVAGRGYAFAAYTGPVPELPAPLPPLHCGALVEVDEGHKIPADVQYVVLSTRADGCVKLARLGGDNGGYWPSVPRAWITELPV